MNPTISSPNMDRIVSRLLLTLLATIFFAALGLGLRTAGLFDFYLTVAVLALSLFMQLTLRGKRLDPPSSRQVGLQNRFEPLRKAINEVPLLQRINTATTYKLTLAFGLGLVLGTFVQNLSVGAFAKLGPAFGGILALFVVIGLYHFIDELLRGSHTYEQKAWVNKLKEGALHVFDNPSIQLSPFARAGIIAAARAAFSVVLRGLALLILPLVFDNIFMVIAAVVGVVFLVAGFDSMPVLWGAIKAAVRPENRDATADGPRD